MEFDGAILSKPERVENTIYWAGVNNDSTDEVKSFISHLVTTRKITGVAEEYRSEPIKFTLSIIRGDSYVYSKFYRNRSV